MIIVPPPIGSAEAKKSVIPSARKTKAQEGYFIGWMLSNTEVAREHGRIGDGRARSVAGNWKMCVCRSGKTCSPA